MRVKLLLVHLVLPWETQQINLHTISEKLDLSNLWDEAQNLSSGWRKTFPCNMLIKKINQRNKQLQIATSEPFGGSVLELHLNCWICTSAIDFLTWRDVAIAIAELPKCQIAFRIAPLYHHLVADRHSAAWWLMQKLICFGEMIGREQTRNQMPEAY